VSTVRDASTASHNSISATESSPQPSAMGWWRPVPSSHSIEFLTVDETLRTLDRPVFIIKNQDGIRFSTMGSATIGAGVHEPDGALLLGVIPKLKLQEMGDLSFCEDYAVQYPYMAGSMANGIASTRLVKAMAQAGMLASFGAAGLGLEEIESAIHDLKAALPTQTYAFNLIHAPNEKGHEDAVVDLFLKHDINLVEASAYLKLTPAVVRYRVSGIYEDDSGNVITPNRIIAKASRIEIANHWFSPPPDKILVELVNQGKITESEASLAARIPMAQDLTVEADSGGHTDNRPAITLVPTIMALRDRLQDKYKYASNLRVGAAGGIATPASAAAAFTMGAAYIVTGTVNQACIESGSSDVVRQMLAQAEQADVTMAPAVDMFEMGVKLQVLKRGTMFAMRGNKLYEAYRKYASLDDIPEAERQSLEKTIFKKSIDDVWQETREFFQRRSPADIQRAESDPKHKMALVFRWYLGLSSRWANAGKEDRQVDYQIWCGPAMGAFNEWVKGSKYETPENRDVVSVAMNLMFGAAQVVRINQIRQLGITGMDLKQNIPPIALTDIERYIG
jgi:trans-AT polyketide synthase/acyltransferase/oxidoreductase domain-containing protein